MGIMAEYAGISSRSIRAALASLEKSYLVEPLGKDWDGVHRWKIFLYPQQMIGRQYLNKKIIDSYRYEIAAEKTTGQHKKVTNGKESGIMTPIQKIEKLTG